MEENKEIMDPAVADSAPEATPTPAPAKQQKNKKIKKVPTPPPEPTDEDDDEKPISKTRKVINTIVNVVLVVAIIMAALCTYISFVSTEGNGVPGFLGVRLLTVESDSMYPKIKEGDLVIDTPVKDASKLQKGDIITYWTTIQGEYVLNTHRINNVFDGGNFILFETKGDKNDYPDPQQVHESEIVGKYAFHIPAVGSLVKYIQTPLGFFIVVIIPVLIFFIYHLVQFFRVLFEYQNVKMLIKYEQERGKTEDLIESQIKDQKTKEEIRRAAMEAELREQLRKEMLAEMQAQKSAEAAAATETASAEPTEVTEESNNSEQ